MGKDNGAAIFLTLLCLALFLVVVAGLGAEPASPLDLAAPRRPAPSAPPAVAPEVTLARPAPSAPERIFDGRMLVAYYGTAGTGVLGVLGETDPDRALARLKEAARPFTRNGRPPKPVFELIVTVADAYPGKGRDYSHDIDRAAVAKYVAAAHRHGVLLLLDIQPGRAPFDHVVRRWAWALRNPWVGLAIDPEWRMGPRQVPARVVGSVSAAEVNRTSAWLAGLTARLGLPQKLFVIHQFRTTMIRGVDRIRSHRHLAMVQHVDGFGTRQQKLDTYHVVAAPHRFRMGFKLFYDEDVRLMHARDVRRIRPRVDFVSYQ